MSQVLWGTGWGVFKCPKIWPVGAETPMTADPQTLDFFGVIGRAGPQGRGKGPFPGRAGSIPEAGVEKIGFKAHFGTWHFFNCPAVRRGKSWAQNGNQWNYHQALALFALADWELWGATGGDFVNAPVNRFTKCPQRSKENRRRKRQRPGPWGAALRSSGQLMGRGSHTWPQRAANQRLKMNCATGDGNGVSEHLRTQAGAATW